MFRVLLLGLALFGCAGAGKPSTTPVEQPVAETKSAPAQPAVACEGDSCTKAPNLQPPCEGPSCAPTCEGINCPPPAQAGTEGTKCPKDAKADDPRCVTNQPMLELK